jgi:hypothetical protein
MEKLLHEKNYFCKLKTGVKNVCKLISGFKKFIQQNK